MAIDLSQLLSLISAVGGGALSANAAGNTSSQLNKLLSSLQGNQLGQFSFNGPGGQSAGFSPTGFQSGAASGSDGGGNGIFRPTPNGGMMGIMGNVPGTQGVQGGGAYGGGAGVGIDLGSLTPAFNSLVGFGTNAVGQAGSVGTPSSVTNANNLTNSLVGGGGFQSSLASAAFGGAQSQLADASRNYGDVYNTTLGALRANAQPNNLLAANQLQDSLFGTGRLGTTGGGNLATAFAKGLGQADAGFQLQAQQAAMQQQNNSLGLAQGLAGIGSGVTSLGENLQQGLFGRANTSLNNQISLAGLPGQLQGQQLGLGLQALQGQGALNQQGISNFQTALQAAIAQANAKNATANAQANVAGTKASTPTSGDIWGQVLTGIGSRLADPNSSLSGLLGGLFGGNSFGTSVDNSYGADALGNALGQQGVGQSVDWGSLFGGFSGAGGQAATAAGGLKDLSNVFGNATQGLDDAQLANYLGSGSAMKAVSDIGNDSSSKNYLGTAGNLAGIYSGIQKGGVTGYAGAANSAAGLVGGSIPAVGYAGAVEQAAKGDVPGAAVSAISTYLPIAGAGFAVANLANKALGVGEKGAITGAYTDTAGATRVYAGKVLAGYQFPDGKYYTQTQAAALAQAWKNGDANKYAELLASYSGKPADGYVVSGGVIKKGG